MIHALLILDESGSVVYYWKHKRASEKVIKKFIPELIGSFVSALISFGSEILEAPRYIDMGVAGASLVKLRIGERSLLAFVIADRDDSPLAINRFVLDFRNKTESLLSKMLLLEEGAILIDEKQVETLDKITEETIKRNTRWLPSIRSDRIRSFLFGFTTALPLITVISTISFALISLIGTLMFGGIGSENYISLFLVAWWVPCIISGIVVGYLVSKAGSAFFAGLFGYLLYWLSLSLSGGMSVIAFVGGTMYAIIVAIFSFVSGRYFDNIKLTAL